MQKKSFLLSAFCFLLFLFFGKICHAQDIAPKAKCKHLLYVEALGMGGLWSINYENNILLKSKFSMGFRGGFSTVHLLDYTRKFNPDLIFPVSIHFLYGTTHRIEVGIGQTISNIPVAKMENNPVHTRITGFSTGFILGYRFEHQKTGIFLKCGYTPIIERNKYYKHWGGISIGYAFK